VPEDERIDDEKASADENEDVEAHGVKQVAGVGLAAAALLGAGAAAVKLTDDDKPSQRVTGALLSPEARNLEGTDLDRDGYLTYRELALDGVKFNVEELNAEGLDVTAEGLSSAGIKIELDIVGEGGFPLKEDMIFLKGGVDDKFDEAVKGSALEWTDKHRAIDRDQDGYAASEELMEAGYKFNVAELNEAGYEISPEALAEAGYKAPLSALGEGGFVTQEDMVMLKMGVDDKLDAFIKGELGEG
jgi:hypothetical protein